MTRWAVLATAILLSVVSVFVFYDGGHHRLAVDYDSFFVAARLPISVLYDGPPFSFVYPPTGIALVNLFALGGYWQGYFALTALSLLSFFLAVRRAVGGRIAALSLLSFAALQGLAWGQLSMIWAAGLFYGLTLSGFRRGFVIGLAIALKPQLFMAAPLIFLVKRDGQAVAGIFVGGALSCLASIAAFGLQPWFDWTMALPVFREDVAQYIIREAAVTPSGYAWISGTWTLPYMALGLAVSAAAIWTAKRTDEPAQLAALIGGASIMASPYALPHDMIVLVPAAVVLLLKPLEWRQGLAACVFAAALLPVTFPAFLLLCLMYRSPGAYGGESARLALFDGLARKPAVGGENV